MWIEIYGKLASSTDSSCRGSREPCGLKYEPVQSYQCSFLSRLARALWIEISVIESKRKAYEVEARESLVD